MNVNRKSQAAKDHQMTLLEQKRLADIHARWMTWNAMADTSTWEVTFFFELLEKKNREIAYWRQQAGRRDAPRHTP